MEMPTARLLSDAGRPDLENSRLTITDPLGQKEEFFLIAKITRPEFFEPELVNVLGHSILEAVTQALLGSEPRAWGINMLWTPKVVGYDLEWHRGQLKRDLYDYIHLKPRAQDHVQYNAALNEDDCFIVVPGSHRRALTPEEWDAIHHEPTRDLPGQVVAALDPGDVLFMEAHALHRGRSDVNRDRLTFHYSAQAQWVPLQAWGDKEHFAWIVSDEFINQLSPSTQPYYQRLSTAARTDDAMEFVKQIAAENGWKRPEKMEAAQASAG
jgi:hypothetical protein